jgi:hypothetical protein
MLRFKDSACISRWSFKKQPLIIGGSVVEKRMWVRGDRLLNPCGLSDVNLCFTEQHPDWVRPGMRGSKHSFLKHLQNNTQRFVIEIML